ncbi:hypothetical protein ACH0BU_12750 [Sphingomonas olei]
MGRSDEANPDPERKVISTMSETGISVAGGGKKPAAARESVDAAKEAVEAAMASVIVEALASGRRWGAKHWYPAVVEILQGTPHAPPSRSKFETRFSAERKRRRELLLAASAQVAAEVGAAVGDEPVEVLPGAVAVGRRAFELAIRALVEWRSPAVGVVWGDYIDLSRRAGEPFVKLDVFRALVFSPFIVAGVPHEMMPDFWRKKLAKLQGDGPARVQPVGAPISDEGRCRS